MENPVGPIIDRFFEVDEKNCHYLVFVQCFKPSFSHVEQNVLSLVIFAESPLVRCNEIVGFKVVVQY